MGYTTLYQITTVEPQSFFQVLQDSFHYHSDLFKYNSHSNLVIYSALLWAMLLPLVVLIIWDLSARILGKPRPTEPEKWKLWAYGSPIALLLLLFGWVTLFSYPIHIKLTQRYANGECTKIEGVIKNAQIAEGGGRWTGDIWKAIFKLDQKLIVIRSDSSGFANLTPLGINSHNVRLWMGHDPISMLNQKTIVIRSDSTGFDNPTHPAIGNGQNVRIWMIERGHNPPIILRFDVLHPDMTCPRALTYW